MYVSLCKSVQEKYAAQLSHKYCTYNFIVAQQENQFKCSLPLFEMQKQKQSQEKIMGWKSAARAVMFFALIERTDSKC